MSDILLVAYRVCNLIPTAKVIKGDRKGVVVTATSRNINNTPQRLFLRLLLLYIISTLVYFSFCGFFGLAL